MVAAKAFVFLGFCAVFGFVVYLLYTEGAIENRFDCDRSAGLCTFTRRFISRTATTREPISALGRAEVRVSTGVRRGPPPIRLWIRARGGDAYFDDYVTRRAANADADRINAFLGSPEPSRSPRFSLVRGHRGMYWTAWGGSFLILILLGGLAWALFIRR